MFREREETKIWFANRWSVSVLLRGEDSTFVQTRERSFVSLDSRSFLIVNTLNLCRKWHLLFYEWSSKRKFHVYSNLFLFVSFFWVTKIWFDLCQSGKASSLKRLKTSLEKSRMTNENERQMVVFKMFFIEFWCWLKAKTRKVGFPLKTPLCNDLLDLQRVSSFVCWFSNVTHLVSSFVGRVAPVERVSLLCHRWRKVCFCLKREVQTE